LFFRSGVKSSLVNLILTLTRAWSTNGITGVVVVTAGVVVVTAGVVGVTAGVVVGVDVSGIRNKMFFHQSRL